MSFHFSFDLKSQEKKNTSKKKTAFSFIQSILLQKVKKMIFSGEKKKVPLGWRIQKKKMEI